MNKPFTSYLIAAWIVTLILACFLGWHFKGSQATDPIYLGTKSDTARTLRFQQPTKLVNVPAKVEYLYRERIEYRDTGHVVFINTDSTYKVPAFIASLDTVDAGDTIHADYMFPDNCFNLFIYRKPDTLTTVTITKEMIIPRTWYEVPAYITAGAVLGILVEGLVK